MGRGASDERHRKLEEKPDLVKAHLGGANGINGQRIGKIPRSKRAMRKRRRRRGRVGSGGFFLVAGVSKGIIGVSTEVAGLEERFLVLCWESGMDGEWGMGGRRRCRRR